MSNHLPAPLSARLVRQSSDRRIAGVCSGLGAYFAVDPIIVRLVFVGLAFTGGIGFVLYAALWLVMPRDGAPAGQAWNQGVQEMREQVQQVAQQVRSEVKPAAGARFDPMTGRPINTEPARFDPYTGAPIASDETAIPLVNANPGGPALPVQRRQRFLGLSMLGIGLLVAANAMHLGAVLVPVAIIGLGLMLLRRTA